MRDQKETVISEEAKSFVKRNKKLLIEKFASDMVCPAVDEPSTVLMAGSPGAGKTEFSLNLIKKLKFPVVRIDPDDVRKILPQYTGKNSDVVQGAASLGVEKLYDYVLAKKKPAIIDGTFSNYEASSKNIKRSLDKGRSVAIFYIYQDPVLAWRFTQAREKEEGRFIPKQAFIDAFFGANENVKKAKQEFGDRIQLFLVKKDYNNDLHEVNQLNGNVDDALQLAYTKKTLPQAL